MNRTIKLGIVGGGFSREFQFSEHPNCQVVAVSEMNPERRAGLQERFQCDRAYETLEEALADREVEAIALFTPPPFHARHSIQTLKAGKHVMCAVPAAMNLEECQQLLDTVKETGLTYMMAETSYYRHETILARNWYEEGRFGEIFHTEAEYWHDNLIAIMANKDGSRNWRRGLAPMQYPTHSTGFLIGVTGERLVRVTCIGWGNDAPELKDNDYDNPFWNEIAFFQTDKGHSSRMTVGWNIPYPEMERCTWYGTKMSFVMGSGAGQPPTKCFHGSVEKIEIAPNFEGLPEALRHESGHGGSHTHLTHEFISALLEGRPPSVDVYEALAYTTPGIVAHQSALRGGESMTIPDFGRRR